LTEKVIRERLNKEFKTTGVLEVLGSYTGRKMLVAGLALELSVPQLGWWANVFDCLGEPPRTLYAHLDESIAFPKAIVYLSDVDNENGPTSCYPHVYDHLQLNPLQELVGRVIGTGSIGAASSSKLKVLYARTYHQAMSAELFRRHFMRLPASMRFNSHFGWDLIYGSELEGLLLRSERKMIGPSGKFIVFDGSKLVHRGGLIQHGERIALQVVFGDSSDIGRLRGIAKRLFK
jgi:hypothetical protein